MSAARLARLAALAFLAWAACGRKTEVRPPQLVAPRSITELEAKNEELGIQLRWERPRRYVDGTTMNDLAGFRIERRREEEDFAVLERVEIEDRYRFQQVKRFRYLDATAETGRVYEYQVFSFTLDGYQSSASNAVRITRQPPPAELPPPPAP